jgi:DNA/RNA-binding protein KIN17
MPKAEAGSLKAIGNHIKSIGLQKLRWYCQMCVKQCRDENGFKCHLTSESHLRQMRLFSQNPNSIIDNFSKEFERGYLDTLSHLHNTKRTSANKVSIYMIYKYMQI